MSEKAMTVRLQNDLAAELEAVAATDGIPVAEAVRQAVASHIESRRKDKAFQTRLRSSIERNRKILEKLSER
jgi:hypothetical protein